MNPPPPLRPSSRSVPQCCRRWSGRAPADPAPAAPSLSAFELCAPSFSFQALERGLHQLIQHPRPLDTEQDVDEIGLGQKTSEKVKEILARGASARAEAAAADPRREVLAVFGEVWGAGPATAARWYGAGCRSLEDARARGDLTEQQRVRLWTGFLLY